MTYVEKYAVKTVSEWLKTSECGEPVVLFRDGTPVGYGWYNGAVYTEAPRSEWPFPALGFTSEDVALLEQEATLTEAATKWCPEGWSVDNPTDQASIATQLAKAQRLRSLSSRIQALLPTP